jgi:hypothetical protein
MSSRFSIQDMEKLFPKALLIAAELYPDASLHTIEKCANEVIRWHLDNDTVETLRDRDSDWTQDVIPGSPEEQALSAQTRRRFQRQSLLKKIDQVFESQDDAPRTARQRPLSTRNPLRQIGGWTVKTKGTGVPQPKPPLEKNVLNKNVAAMVLRHNRNMAVHQVEQEYRWVKITDLSLKVAGTSGVGEVHVLTDVDHFMIQSEYYNDTDWAELCEKLDRYEDGLREHKAEGSKGSLYLCFRRVRGHPDGEIIVDVSPVNDFTDLENAVIGTYMNVRKTRESYQTMEASKRDDIEKTKEQQRTVFEKFEKQRDQLREHQKVLQEQLAELKEQKDKDVLVMDVEHKNSLSRLGTLLTQIQADEAELRRSIAKKRVSRKVSVLSQAAADAAAKQDDASEKDPPSDKLKGLIKKSNARVMADFAGQLARGEVTVTTNGQPDDSQEVAMLRALLEAANAKTEAAVAKTEAAEAKAAATATEMRLFNYTQMVRDWQAKSAEEIEMYVQYLAEEDKKELDEKDRKKFYSDADKILKAINERDNSQPLRVNIRGNHPREELAVRGGVHHKKDRIDIEIIRHLTGNSYLVKVSEHHLQIIACLGIEKRDERMFYIKTWKHQEGHRWVNAEKRICGYTAKMETGLPIQQYLDWHKQISSELFVNSTFQQSA